MREISRGRLKIRQEKELPIIEELTEKILGRLGDTSLLLKFKFRGVLTYFAGLLPYVKNYTNHAFARLDNNMAERTVRPLAISRKNWLFFGKPRRGKSVAIILSLVQTCR